MIQFYTLPKESYLKVWNKIGTHHYIDLSDGLILLSGNDEIELLKAEGVQPLPHVLSGQNIKNHPNFAHLQKHLGAEETDTTFMLAEKARKIHPLMRY